MSLFPPLALLLAAAPPASLATVAERALPQAADSALIQDLATGELLLVHHPAALTRAYPPGSTLKIISAYVALSQGGDAARLHLRCAGHAEILGRRRECWERRGHGPVDLDRALADSCNLFFYELGTHLSPAAWLDAARAFGLGRATGAPLEGESEGELPGAMSLEELSDAAAGEGEHLRVTPLQMLGLASVIATGGERLRPVRAGQPRQVAARLGDGAALRRLADDLRRAVRSGTLADSGLEALGVAGKTGTGRWAHGYHKHGWFLGFAPESAPRYAMVVFVNQGLGAADAGRAARTLFEALLHPQAEPPPHAVRVRVLEHSHPTRLRLQLAAGVVAACDGEPVSGADLRVRADGSRVTVEAEGEEKSCLRLCVDRGPTAVSLPSIEFRPRRYSGALQLDSRGRELAVINEVGLEDYVAGVVEAEAQTELPAALEAQAVVSRTFALEEAHRHGADYDFCDLTHCQVYRGLPERSPARRAAEATAGQVLRADGKLIHAYFHSTCAGHTSDAARVLGDPPQPALAGVSDLDPHGHPWCAGSPHLDWKFTAAHAEIARRLAGPVPEDGVKILERDPWGTVLRLRAFGLTLSGEAFKSRMGRAFGWQSIRSARFDVEEREGKLLFTGRGLGHGVGLCQYGAAGQAAAGRTSAQILSHYYPGAVVEAVDAR